MREYIFKHSLLFTIIVLGMAGVLIIINMMGGNKNGGHSNINNNNPDNITSTTTIDTTTTMSTKSTRKTTRNTTTTRRTTIQREIQKVGTYTLTHYGWDCEGCKGGTTATGYNVKNTIYYKDPTYGSLRIVAMRNIPTYSVIKIKNYDGQNIMAIVLDRCKSGSIVDLLVQNENTASKLGIRRNIEIEVIRNGK